MSSVQSNLDTVMDYLMDAPEVQRGDVSVALNHAGPNGHPCAYLAGPRKEPCWIEYEDEGEGRFIICTNTGERRTFWVDVAVQKAIEYVTRVT